MIDSKVSEFLEKNIHLIDQNDFVNLYFNLYEEDDLSVVEAGEVGLTLTRAKIDFKSQREEALGRIITPNIELWAYDSSGGVTAMPLEMFIEAFLGNRLGLGIPFITKYMIKHISDWEQYIDIYEENGILIINKEKSL